MVAKIAFAFAVYLVALVFLLALLSSSKLDDVDLEEMEHRSAEPEDELEALRRHRGR